MEKQVVHVIESGNIAVQIFLKENMDNGKVYYDLRVSRFYMTPEGEEKYSPMIQQRDLLDAQKCLVESQQWIHRQHRVRRGIIDD